MVIFGPGRSRKNPKTGLPPPGGFQQLHVGGFRARLKAEDVSSKITKRLDRYRDGFYLPHKTKKLRFVRDSHTIKHPSRVPTAQFFNTFAGNNVVPELSAALGPPSECTRQGFSCVRCACAQYAQPRPPANPADGVRGIVAARAPPGPARW